MATSHGDDPSPLYAKLPFTKADWAILIAVTLLAALIRLPGLETAPPGLWRDEAGYGLAGNDILHGALRVYWGDKEPFFPYVLAGVFALFGPSVLALRTTAALFGTGTVALTYLLGRSMLGRAGGLIAAVGLATVFWHIDLSRIGFRVSTMPFVVTLAFLLLWLAMHRERRWLWIAGGVALGLTPYTYLAARMAPIAIGLFFLYLLAFHRRLVLDRRADWLTYFGVSLLTVLPLLVFYAFNPSYLIDRASQLSPFSVAKGPWDDLLIALGGIKDTALMFFVHGDNEPRHNIPGRPALDLATGWIFGLGVLVAAWRIRRPAMAMLLFWTVLLLLPSSLSLDNPHYLRTLGAAPAVLLLVGVGASMVGSSVRRWLKAHQIVRWLVPIGAAVWLIAAGLVNLNDYFNVWARDPKTAAFFESEVATAGRMLASVPSDAETYFSAPFVPHPDEQFLNLNRPEPIWFDGQAGLVTRPGPAPAAGRMYALPASNETALLWLRRLYPKGLKETTGQDGFGRDSAVLVTAPAGVSPVLPVPERPLNLAVGPEVSVSGYGPAAETVQPGGTLTVTLYWKVNGPTEHPDYAFFVHLVDGQGKPYGQNDAVAYPSFAWQGGEQVVSWFGVPVPDDTPPGLYHLVAGVYPRATLTRLPVVDAATGRALGDTFDLGSVKVPLPPTEPTPALQKAATFGSIATLTGADIGADSCDLGALRPPCTLDITLYWKALQQTNEDYVVFLHLAGPDGRPVVQADGPPRGGAYPTSIWAAGETIPDRHVLTIPAGTAPGSYRLLAGLYRRDGARLPVQGGGDSVPLAEITLMP